MSVTPEKDPNYIYAHPYATLIADEYRMRGGYCIVRPGGTDDHLMLLTRAGRGLFRTPQAYVESCRLEYAKRLLETTNASVKEASYAAGFAYPLYFSRRFRRAYGLPPREIAKR